MTKLKTIVLTGFLGVSLLLSSGCSKTGLSSYEKVATVDGTVITKGDYDRVSEQVGRMFHLSENPEAAKNPMIVETIKRMALQKLIINTILKNGASQVGATVSAKDVQALKQEQIKEVGDEETFKRLLTENNITESELRERLEEQVLVNQFLEKKFGTQTTVTPEDANKFYESHPTEFQVPETIQASHILVKAIDVELKRGLQKSNPNISDAALAEALQKQKQTLKAKAQQLYEQAQKTPDQFADIARKSSDDIVSAKNGGDLGPRAENELEPTFWGAIKKTAPGSLYPGVLETPFGYHVIRVKDHISPHKQTYNDVQSKIFKLLGERKKKELLDQWFREQLSTAKIVIEPKYQAADPEKLHSQEGKVPQQAKQVQGNPHPESPSPSSAHP